MSLTDIYRAVYFKLEQCSFISHVHVTFSNREHTTAPKQILMTWNIIWVIKHTLCLQCKSITIGSWETCKLTRIKTPLNNRYFKEISAKENREHFEFGENKGSPCQNSRGAAKSVLRGKFIATRSKELRGPLFKLLILYRTYPKSYWSMWPFCDDKGFKPMQLSPHVIPCHV